MFEGKVGTPRRSITLEPRDDLGRNEVPTLIACSARFPEHIGRGCEDFHPRWFSWLSDALIEYLATLLWCLERRGIWPWQISEIIVAQIPKGDGGRRPIGLLPALVKVSKSEAAGSGFLENPSRKAVQLGCQG